MPEPVIPVPNPDTPISTPPQNPTPNPAPSTDGNIDTTVEGRNLFMQALRESNNENLRLKQELEQARNQRQPSPDNQVDPWNQFTNDPRALIREEIQNTTAPLNSFIARYEKQTEIDKLKRMYRSVPDYAPLFQYAEDQIDNLLMGAGQINAQTMEFALMTVAGAIATGKLKIPGFQFGNSNPPTPTPTPAPRSPIIPPNAPRSTPPVPDPTHGTEGARELTETERRFARFNKMTDAEFLAGLEGDVMIAKSTGAK
jgi:hypothetical protein